MPNLHTHIAPNRHALCFMANKNPTAKWFAFREHSGPPHQPRLLSAAIAPSYHQSRRRRRRRRCRRANTICIMNFRWQGKAIFGAVCARVERETLLHVGKVLFLFGYADMSDARCPSRHMTQFFSEINNTNLNRTNNMCATRENSRGARGKSHPLFKRQTHAGKFKFSVCGGRDSDGWKDGYAPRFTRIRMCYLFRPKTYSRNRSRVASRSLRRRRANMVVAGVDVRVGRDSSVFTPKSWTTISFMRFTHPWAGEPFLPNCRRVSLVAASRLVAAAARVHQIRKYDHDGWAVHIIYDVRVVRKVDTGGCVCVA